MDTHILEKDGNVVDNTSATAAEEALSKSSEKQKHEDIMSKISCDVAPPHPADITTQSEPVVAVVSVHDGPVVETECQSVSQGEVDKARLDLLKISDDIVKSGVDAMKDESESKEAIAYNQLEQINTTSLNTVAPPVQLESLSQVPVVSEPDCTAIAVSQEIKQAVTIVESSVLVEGVSNPASEVAENEETVKKQVADDSITLPLSKLENIATPTLSPSILVQEEATDPAELQITLEEVALVVEAPEAAPVAEAPEVAPVAKAPEPAPVPKAPEPAPVAEAHEAAPVAEAPEAAPVAEAPKAAPVAEAPEAAPVAEAPKAAPVAEAPETAPVAEAPEAAPVAEASEAAPVVEAPITTNPEVEETKLPFESQDEFISLTEQLVQPPAVVGPAVQLSESTPVSVAVDDISANNQELETRNCLKSAPTFEQIPAVEAHSSASVVQVPASMPLHDSNISETHKASDSVPKEDPTPAGEVQSEPLIVESSTSIVQKSVSVPLVEPIKPSENEVELETSSSFNSVTEDCPSTMGTQSESTPSKSTPVENPTPAVETQSAPSTSHVSPATEFDILPSSYVVLETRPSSQPNGDPKIIQWSATPEKEEEAPIHCTKWIVWKGMETPIVTQNVNGPCPLLAIVNVLLLKRQIELPPKTDIVTSARLLELIGNTILENVPKNITETDKINYEQNVSDVLGILPKLQSGIDVNVKFTGVSDFEYTPELALFDLLHIPLYHGWVVDRVQKEEVEAVGSLGYNQLVERIISAKSDNEQEGFLKAAVAEAFLERTASQLTYQGLLELASTLQDDELAVFFRNNHFSTLYRTGGQLFTLVTDQGLLQESKVVWETLQDIAGSGQFVDAEFKIEGKPIAKLTKIEQIDHDFEIAAQLQREADELQEASRCSIGNGQPCNDEQLARQLQEEEEKRARPSSSAASVSPTRSEPPTVEQPEPKNGEKKSFCTIM